MDGYDADLRDGLEDWDFWLRCANQGLWGATIPEVIDWYRRRKDHGDRWRLLGERAHRDAFREILRSRYPLLYAGDFPKLAPRWPIAFETPADELPADNLLEKSNRRLLMIVPWLALGGSDKFNLDVVAAKEWSSALKFDLEHPPAVQEWSFAYSVIESEMETRDEEEVRILKKMDIIEVSPVLRGAGVGTGTIAAKQRFADQLDSTLKAIEDTLERAKSIAKLRANNDKPGTLSDDHKARIKAMRQKFEEIQVVLSGSVEKDGPEMPALADRLFSDATRLGVDIKD